MSKRANGEGSIHQRKDGRWCASVSVGCGKRKHFLGRTRGEVSRKLTAEMKSRHDGLPTITDRQTVEQYLLNWLKTARPSIRERTWVRYEQYVRLHAVPEFGKLSL